MPLESTIAASAPFDGVRFNDGTICAGCHGNEHPAEGTAYADAFSSEAFRPDERYQVKLDTLERERQACDFISEPGRCEMLSAIFDGGPLETAVFSKAMAVFF